MKPFPFLLLFVFPFIFSCKNDIEKIKLITFKDTLPSQSAKNIEIIYSDSAIVKAKITAAQLDRYANKGNGAYSDLPKGVKILFYDRNMNIQSQLTANHATRYDKTRMMEANNNVVVINEKGEQLNTEHLIWDAENKKITSNEFVKITTADEIIYGDGLEANQNFTKYKIFNIKGTITLNKEHK